MKRFREGLAFKAHKLSYLSTLGSKVRRRNNKPGRRDRRVKPAWACSAGTPRTATPGSVAVHARVLEGVAGGVQRAIARRLTFEKSE